MWPSEAHTSTNASAKAGITSTALSGTAFGKTPSLLVRCETDAEPGHEAAPIQ